MVNIVKCAYGAPRHSEYEDTLRERSKLARSMQQFDCKQLDNGTCTAGEHDEKPYGFVPTPQYCKEASRRTFKSAKRKFTMQERMALVDELPEDDDELL